MLQRAGYPSASQIPRNSRELAVRNQFFTPRYVVEFLTDNTLGRIWYEMTQGLTSQESVHLVKGLVLAQNRWRVDSGSVSPVIWVFKLLRRQMDTRELAEWVMARTRNPYEPFGTSRSRAPCRLQNVK